MGIKILFLVPYPLKKSPSQRFRFEQYFSLLQNEGFQFSVSTFLNAGNWQIFSFPGKPAQKAWALIMGYIKRLWDTSRAPFYDYIFIHREASPVGPPVFEWTLKHIFRKKIIYDFDDAIWLTDNKNESDFQQMLKWRSKVKSICRWSFKVCCSNEYLCNYSANLNQQIVYLPTTVDTDYLHNPNLHLIKKNESQITVGWTGSYSTLKYLNDVEQVISEILLENPQVTFIIIADRKPSLSIPFKFVEWNPVTEIQDLLEIDIGIMPLPDDDWAKGKSGFKCLQYLALEIPAVASDVGVNSKIIDHGINGFIAHNEKEWKNYLIALIKDKNMRQSFGTAGQKKVKENYSVTSNSPVFLSLFK